MVQSNEINMNLAAVTPAVLLIYLAQRGVKFLLYALLKIGKSRAETYSSFRQIILDIERLLVMRHNPPSSPQPISWGAKPERSQESVVSKNTGADTLSADDTGMLMLHIHECRTILWLDRSRFSAATLRNVAEDLAELAGERGMYQLPHISQSLVTFAIFLTSVLLFFRSGQRPATTSHRHAHG